MMFSNDLKIANEMAAQTATEFWKKFQAVQTALTKLSRFMGKDQFITLACRLRNDKDAEHFHAKVHAMAARIAAMPLASGGNHGVKGGEDIAYLRYHRGSMVVYVTAKDCLDGGGNASYAFGWYVSDQRLPEASVIDIAHILHHEFLLDLDFVPTTVSTALAGAAA